MILYVAIIVLLFVSLLINTANQPDKIIYKKGFKVLRIKSGYAIPSKEQLFEGLRILSETDKNYYEIIMEDYALKDK